jgi:hypothetical protein
MIAAHVLMKMLCSNIPPMKHEHVSSIALKSSHFMFCMIYFNIILRPTHTFPSLSLFYGFESNSRPSVSHRLSYAACFVHSNPYFITQVNFVKKKNCNVVVFSILLLFSLCQILSLVSGAQILVLGFKPSFMPLHVITVS